MPWPFRSLLFVDVETTGLDPKKDSIIEIAARRLIFADAENPYHRLGALFSTLIEGGQSKIEASDWHRENFKGADWSVAMPLDVALSMLASMCVGETWGGQNPSFDRAFVSAAWAAAGIPHPEMDYHVVDVCSLAVPMVLDWGWEGVGLKHTTKGFGWQGALHRAGDDVNATIYVFGRLCETFFGPRMLLSHPARPATDSKWKHVFSTIKPF